jgi:ATP-dependent Lhr-like helicase
MARRPPDILITTPESLFLILSSRARSILASVEVVILDEIHALVGTKRGAHLALSVERVAEMAGRDIQRIGLSATQRPLEVVARFLGGGLPGPRWNPRPVTIVDAGWRKTFDLRVETPVEDMSRLGEAMEPESGDIPEGPASLLQRRSIWPWLHERLLELIRSHRSTLLFVNSRRLAERLAAALNEKAGEELVRAHHGSIAREERLLIEDDLKSGRLPALVATSTLELGIDMGAVDLVVQIEAPSSVASGVQRIGRSCHRVDAVPRGLLFPKHRGDLLAMAAITQAMQEGEVEPIRMPENPLDVLAQHLVSMVLDEERNLDELYSLVRRAAPYAGLPRGQFEGILEMLSGRYPWEAFSGLRPRVVWDRLRGTVRAREGARTVVVTNAGTIPDRGLYGVFLAEPEDSGSRKRGGRRVGELDEEMVFECRAGEVFILGASSWRILEITRDRVLVVPAPGEPGKMPFWRADRPPRPVELGLAIGRLIRRLTSLPKTEAIRTLIQRHAFDERAARNLLDYLEEQRRATGVLPDDRTLVLERFRDEMGDWRLCFLSPLGGRVLAPLTLAIRARLRRAGESEIDALWSDEGMVFRLPERDRPPEAQEMIPQPEELEQLLTGELGGSALFAATFREAAARALLLPRRRPGRRTPLWLQRKRSADLLSVASKFPSFPIVLETFRECLKDIFDLPAVLDLLERFQRREIRVVTVDTTGPSPFASSLMFGYMAYYIYDGDAPPAERRAHALAVDQRQLRELLGEAEFRELLDPEVLESLERTLQGLDPDRAAHTPDRLHDLLLRLGDLTLEEIASRVAPKSVENPSLGERSALAQRLVEQLERERRVIRIRVAGQERFIAAEDAGRYRDAIGVQPPPGLPTAFLEPVPDALPSLVRRYARTHGPFRAVEVARRYGLGESSVAAVLQRLAASGRILEGEFRPGGRGREWCDPDVLASLRRRSLARLRRQVEPAEPEALARLFLHWQGVIPEGTSPSAPSGGPDALLDVVERLQGTEIPASALESDILPARLPGYRPEDLDILTAAGEVVWVGLSPLGERDGKVALFLADDLHLLRPPPGERPSGRIHEAIRQVLGERGALFFPELYEAVGGGLQRAVIDALWELVWAGEVTNDSLAPLRAYLGRPSGRRRERRRLAPFRPRRPVPPVAVGRWSLIPRTDEPSAAERLTALAEQLLSRYGIVTRDVVTSEGIPGGFAALYPVLAALEEKGRIRRGYFVVGLGGSQFAEPAALDRLRALRRAEAVEDQRPEAVVLAAVDPANPYGTILPWPSMEGIRLARVPGSHVVLVNGSLAAYLSREEKDLHCFLPEEEPFRSAVGRATACALLSWMQRTGRSGLGWSLNAHPPANKGPLASYLLEVGLQPTGPGFRIRKERAEEPSSRRSARPRLGHI